MARTPDSLDRPGLVPPDDDPEKTFILKPPPDAATPSRRTPWLIGVASAVAVSAGLLLWFLPGLISPRPTVPLTPPPARIVDTAPLVPIVVATEAQIATHHAERLTVFRFADNPRVLILDYPTLREQGLALNRIAAFVEKASVPKDKVLDDASLATEIAKAGDTIDSYYYGHDYGADDLTRFFALADRDGIRLSEQEEFLRRLIQQERLGDPAQPSAIITVPRVGPDSVDGFTRRVILRHELSHGEFFTNPAYAAFARRAWSEILSAEERAAFQRFLVDLNYDSANTELIINEMQAFLMFTPDDRYASAERLGLTQAGLLACQSALNSFQVTATKSFQLIRPVSTS